MADTKGSAPSIAGLEALVSAAVTKALGEANLQARGLSFGKVQHGEMVGKIDAQYATIKTVAGTNEYEVPHTLGRQAGFCMLVNSENRQTPTSKYAVSNVRRDEWGKTTCRVDVFVVSGSLSGGELTFLVGGER